MLKVMVFWVVSVASHDFSNFSQVLGKFDNDSNIFWHMKNLQIFFMQERMEFGYYCYFCMIY